MRHYDKLVRDRVPELIQKKGEPCRFHPAPPGELPRYLLAKLREEVAELVAVLDEPAKAEEEVADVMEVVTAIVRMAGLSEERLMARSFSAFVGPPEPTERYGNLLWNSVQPFGTSFGNPDELTEQLRVLLDVVDLLCVRGGLSPIAVFFLMNVKREECGAFRDGLILDEA